MDKYIKQDFAQFLIEGDEVCSNTFQHWVLLFLSLYKNVYI